MSLELRRFVAGKRQSTPAIWQIKLRDGRGLCDLARERGLDYWCLNDDMNQLWKLGLLKADQIISNRISTLKNLEKVGETFFGQHVYADYRVLKIRKKGLGNAFKNRRELPKGFQPNFHPFRYFVLQALHQILSFRATQMQLLYSAKGMINIAKDVVEHFERVTSSQRFYERFEHLNLVVDLAVSCEPVSFSQVFGFHSWPVFELNGPERNEKTYNKELNAYRSEHSKLLKGIGLPRIKEIHEELCREAHFLDKNTDLQRILRFTSRDLRIEKIRGPLGGSMYLQAMAEMIRRASEKTFKTKLPEEDESGIYSMGETGKEFLYGAKRLIDSPKAQKNFLRRFRLDRDIRLSWYVEGYTEYGAVSAVLGNHSAIEIINLKGQIVARGGRGLAFQDNLKNDIANGVYSWVSLDGDDDDYVRALKQAVDNGDFFGMFFISSPDFEFGNFNLRELTKMIVQRAQVVDPSVKTADLESYVKGAAANGEFFAGVKKALPYHTELKKDEEWGRLLIEYADKHPRRPRRKAERQIITSIREALYAVQTNYHNSKKDGMVDWTTGRIVYPKP